MHTNNLQELRKSEFIPISEAAEKLGISKPLAYRIIREGRLRVHNFGKKCLRISSDDLQAYIRRSAQQG